MINSIYNNISFGTKFSPALEKRLTEYDEKGYLTKGGLEQISNLKSDNRDLELTLIDRKISTIGNSYWIQPTLYLKGKVVSQLAQEIYGKNCSEENKKLEIGDLWAGNHLEERVEDSLLYIEGQRKRISNHKKATN